MTHQERQALIRRPFTLHTTSRHSWGGTYTGERHSVMTLIPESGGKVFSPPPFDEANLGLSNLEQLEQYEEAMKR